MICKKCGENIADTSKFCGYCGNPIDQLTSDKPVNQEFLTDENVEQSQHNIDQMQPIVSGDISNESDLPAVDMNASANIGESIDQVPAEQSVEPNEKSNKNADTNKIILIVVGIVLAVVALVLLFIALNKSSNNSATTLERAMNNFIENGKSSGTIDAKILIESSTSDTINLSATVKYAKANNEYNLGLTLNRSILSDEMNLYSKVTENDATLYVQSNLLDMLGLSSSEQNVWLYYFMDLTDVIDYDEIEADYNNSLSGILDAKHFKYINRVGNLNHYQLIIDNDLIKKIESRTTEEEQNVIDNYMDSINQGELTETYVLDLYINDSDELIKISMDLANYIDDEEISKALLSIEFSNFNNTIVTIPNDALVSQMDIETYMSIYGTTDVTEDHLDINAGLSTY